MTIDYTVTLTDTENKALSYAAFSQQDWIDNAVHERCRVATDEIVQITVRKCLETGTQIPATVPEIVDLGFQMGWVVPAADRVTEETSPMTQGA